jgi:type I restriction enzyme S subunit
MSKNNEYKLVPRLRFPEFENAGEWEMLELSEITDRITEKIETKKITTVSISAGLGFVSQAEKFSRDISGQQYKNYIHLRKDEFAYNKGNSKTFPQGCIYKLIEFDEAAVPNAFICFRFKSKVVADFYQGYFANNFHGKQLKKFITSGARMDGLLNISPSDFFSISFPTPTKREEQQKIASCLSSLDEVIRAESQKLELYQQHKKGLLQNLFPQEGETVPKLRFKDFEESGEWVEKTLGEICDVRDGTHDSPKYVSQGYPLVTSKNLMSNGMIDFINVDYLTEYDYNQINKRSKVDVGDILFGMIGTIGNPVIVRTDGFAIKNVALIKSQGVLNQEFLVYQFKSDFIEKQFGRVNAGGILKFIALGMIRNLDIFVPNLAEQQKIASCLSSIDDLINAQRQKIELLKQHKKGLLQGLFPPINN